MCKLTWLFISKPHDVSSFATLLWRTLFLVLNSHVVDKFYIAGQKLLHMVTCMMPVYPMSIAHSQKPVVLNLAEVLHNKVRILVGLRWLVRNEAGSRFEWVFQKGINKANVLDLLIIILRRVLPHIHFLISTASVAVGRALGFDRL